VAPGSFWRLGANFSVGAKIHLKTALSVYSRQESFKNRENIFYSKNALCCALRCKFYSAGIVTQGCRIQLSVTQKNKWSESLSINVCAYFEAGAQLLYQAQK
jgi:hypothetical protein